ncbi:riboflavin biosynthesis protein RibF [Prevotella sp. oral taxon 376]|uniref:bifunctional riboflavin kinase/FAD synthetase n=1 Tax=Prevotella sp. oral taxon 376 TaxID=712466 RepID=UPI000D1DA2DB|nr:bifunctional riboflavin kinase/FAD synthetase [Prevotella sp. oral taxon 376]PTL32274.1 riboflavin biosynthesis protein RibF [Prevotella sp. oral taxon 376]
MNTLPQPCVATIGFFDGVHRGHRFLIDHVKAEAERSGMASMVITFDEHPRRVLQSNFQPDLLCTLESKRTLLLETGIDHLEILHFNKEMSQLSAREFMKQILQDKFHVRKLVIGYDNRFGHNRSEGFDDYARYGQELGIEVIHNEAFTIDGEKVSSSAIRRMINRGDIGKANRFLGYPYTLMGKVTGGHQEGRKLGFPTANLNLANHAQLVPAPGVYAVRAQLKQSTVWHRGMMNIGTRPTFGGTETTLETHILDFRGNIYGQILQVSFVQRIREERKFDTPSALKAQLEKDKQQIEQRFEKLSDNE